VPPVPRWLARLWLVAGGAGILASLSLAVVGWVVVGSFRAGLIDTLDATAQVVEVVGDTVEVLDAGFADVAVALDTTEQALGDAAATLTTVGLLTQDLSRILGDEVPAQIESVLAALPPLADTARVVDRTMRALSLVGVSYDPEVPLDETVLGVAESLAPLPERLRDQRRLLERAADELVAFSVTTDGLAGDIGVLRGRLDESAMLLEGYGKAVADASVLLAELRADLAVQGQVVRVLLVAAGLAGAGVSTFPLVVGRWALAVPPPAETT
jgi:hypothetical protein